LGGYCDVYAVAVLYEGGSSIRKSVGGYDGALGVGYDVTFSGGYDD